MISLYMTSRLPQSFLYTLRVHAVQCSRECIFSLPNHKKCLLKSMYTKPPTPPIDKTVSPKEVTNPKHSYSRNIHNPSHSSIPVEHTTVKETHFHIIHRRDNRFRESHPRTESAKPNSQNQVCRVEFVELYPAGLISSIFSLLFMRFCVDVLISFV